MWQNHLGWWKKIPGDLPTIHTALPPISLKWSSFNFGLWRHFFCSRKKFLGLLGGSPALHPIFCSHSPWPVPQSSLLAWLSWRYLTLCLHALPWAGPAACNISCQSLMVMWENTFHLSGLNSNTTFSTKVFEFPPAPCNPSCMSTQRTFLEPLLGQALCLIHVIVIWIYTWFF